MSAFQYLFQSFWNIEFPPQRMRSISLIRYSPNMGIALQFSLFKHFRKEPYGLFIFFIEQKSLYVAD